jgi:signal transduction histidine kinase
MNPSNLSFSRLKLWPLFLLLAAELAALGAILRFSGQDPLSWVTRFSALVAFLILLSGFLPALLRPSSDTLIAGCLATVMASVVVIPFSAEDLPAGFSNTSIAQLAAPFLILRLVNGVWIGPLAFHLAIRFPQRQSISDRSLAVIYIVSLGLLVLLLLAGFASLRILAALALLVWSIGLVIGAGAILLRSSRRVDPQDPRPAQQARLLFVAIALAGLPALLRPLGLVFRADIIPYDLMLAALILIPLGIAYAVLQADLFGIDRVLRRALAYAALSLLLLVIYFALTLGLTALLARLWPGLRGLATLLALFAAALAFEPSRRRLQSWVDRLLYPDRLRFQQAVVEARHAIGRVAGRQEIVSLLTSDFPTSLGADWAVLSLAPDPETPGRAPGEPAWNAQLVAGGHPLGRYWLGPRRQGPGYDADETAQLQTLAGQAALALAYAGSIEELRGLNRELEERVAQRTVQVLDQQRALAAHGERQRLARDLHDSVTQSLFSINLSARALRNLVRRDPPAAIDGLVELETAAQQALSEMRALLAQLRASVPEPEPPVGQLHPTQPDSLDLVALLEQHCARLQHAAVSESGELPFNVRVTAPDLIPLPAPLASELIQALREALHNVLKHSGIRQAECAVTCQDGWLHISVIDHGVGFDPQQVSSGAYGLRGINERLTALNGSLEVHSAPGKGTVLEMHVPYP